MISLTTNNFSEAFVARRAILATSAQSCNKAFSLARKRFSTGAPPAHTPSTNSPEWKAMLRDLENYHKYPPISRRFITGQTTFKFFSIAPRELAEVDSKFNKLKEDQELENTKK
ncbi:hypothetical protein [Parachlamydia sp. AcF125]|uniref:hypothetical protein n=1 Tax=Parachlamydia sp. AcF125 TaxID=2795736 RepID=UPI001BCA57D3|nr:hypothetical protein [Parachlamydia sp. AcF125]MBS4167772.1 hypothetical protein [Parachlamydia sp. AcF125]